MINTEDLENIVDDLSARVRTDTRLAWVAVGLSSVAVVFSGLRLLAFLPP